MAAEQCNVGTDMRMATGSLAWSTTTAALEMQAALLGHDGVEQCGRDGAGNDVGVLWVALEWCRHRTAALWRGLCRM